MEFIANQPKLKPVWTGSVKDLDWVGLSFFVTSTGENRPAFQTNGNIIHTNWMTVTLFEKGLSIEKLIINKYTRNGGTWYFCYFDERTMSMFIRYNLVKK